MAPEIEEKAIEDEAKPIAPVQFFDHGEGFGIDRDFRPVPIDDQFPREDGHGNRFANPQNDGGNVLNPGEAWDPHVVPYRDRPAADRVLDLTPPTEPATGGVSVGIEVEVTTGSPDVEPAPPPVLHPSTLGSPPPFASTPPTPTAQEAEPAQE